MLIIQKLIKSLTNVPIEKFFLHKVSGTPSGSVLENEHLGRYFQECFFLLSNNYFLEYKLNGYVH